MRVRLLVGYLLFVVYGSLVPLDWHPLPWDEAWQRFQAIPFLQLGVESRADWVANGVLYVPLGVLGARALAGAGGRVGMGAGLVAWMLAVLLALVVEFAQLQFPPRTVSQNDLIAEAVGAGLGVLLAPWLQGWLDQLAGAWGRDVGRLTHVLLLGYAAGYGLHAFFPYDLLLSPVELSTKLASPLWGWLLARPQGATGLRAGLQLAAEVAMTVPIGLLLRGWSPVRAGLAGLAMGLVIEWGQVFIASGVSQGASVLSRGLGVGLGAALAHRGLSLPIARVWLYRHRRSLLLAYLGMLLVVTLGRFQWGGWDRAWQSWHELRWLPFYYHYYTSEAVALTSLGATVLMYAPLGALAWARHVSPGAAALVAVLLAVPIEALRIFMADTRPDPTNVLLAAASVWLLVRLLSALDVQRQRSALSIPALMSAPPAPPVASPTMAGATTALERAATGPDVGATVRRTGWAWLVLLPVWAAAALWPAGAWLLLPLLVLVAIAVAWLPALALVIVPAALPLLDLAPWSGRFFVDEFDLLCATALSIGLAHTRQVPPTAGTARGVFAAFGVSLAVAALLPLARGVGLDLNSFSHLHSPYNGLRILKGALWAWLFITLYRRLVARRESLAPWLPWGLVIGLAGVVMVVLWERAAFTGWLDFGTDYRVTGPFSVMNKGGAYIECFLAVSMAALLVMGARQRGGRLLAAGVLMALASYALFVTYSRNGYAALVAAVLVVAPALWRRDVGNRAKPWAGLVLIAMAMLAAVPVLTGGFARERLAQIERDFDVRWRHWQLALGLRDDSALAAVFGTGLGRFPERHAWHSRGEPRAAGYRLEPGEGNPFLRLAPGATVYVEQIVGAPAGQQDLQLTINLRSATRVAPVLTLTLCRKWLLTSADCEAVTVEGIAAPGAWQTQYATVLPLPPPASRWQSWMPVKLSLHTPGGRQAVDVDNVSLASAGRTELMRNGSFARGMDHWFFATDVDPPWHIHSLPVGVLFDQGWFGVITGLSMLGVAGLGGARALARGSLPGAAAAGGLAAFLVSGSLNTLIDEPRFLWLLLVLAWLCSFHGRAVHGASSQMAAGEPFRADSSYGRRSQRTALLVLWSLLLIPGDRSGDAT